MKILHIMGYHSQKFGGLERFLVALSKSIPENRHIFVFLSKPAEPFYSLVGADNIRVLSADIDNMRTLIPGFVRLLKTEVNIDAVHFHFGFSFGILSVIARMYGIKKIYKTEHCCFTRHSKQVYDMRHYGMMSKLYSLWGFPYRLITASLPVSYEVGMQVCGIFGKRATVIPTYLGIEDAAISERKPSNNDFVISTIGFANPIKGIDIVIKALPLVKDSAIRLILIGLDETLSYTKEMHKLAEELGVDKRITWVGITNDTKSWLRQSDVFIQASRTEALSLAAVEACCLGIPVIGSKVGGLPEASSRTFPVGDTQALAENIDFYRANENARLHDAAESRHRYLEKFTLEKGIKNYNKIYFLAQYAVNQSITPPLPTRQSSAQRSDS